MTLNLRHVLLLVFVTLIGIVWAVSFHFPLAVGFLPGYIFEILLAKKKGLCVKRILHISLAGVQKTKIVIIILFLVSFLLPSWYLSGTIDQLVRISLHFMGPEHFFVLAFLLAMIFSMLLGSTVGTLSTIGVPILGAAVVLHLPMEVAAGALVSGAFVGDRTSPFSSAHQLLSHTVEVSVKEQWKAMLRSSILAVGICFIAYGLLDLVHSSTASMDFQPFSWSQISVVRYMPPLILIGIVLFRVGIIYAFLSSILSAVFISLLAGTPVLIIMNSFWKGIDGLGGGLGNMYELLLFLALAGAYNGLLEELNLIQPYLNRWLHCSRSLVGDTVKAVAATLLISVIAANQTLPIILTGRSFLPHWTKKYGKEELARVMGDTTMLFPGLVPWSVLAIMCSTIVGVPLASYLPYAIFLWVLPVVTIFLSLWKQMKKTKENQPIAA